MIQNNNPGNLRHSSAYTWAGEILPPDPRGLCRFDTAHNGLRALAKELWSYWTKDQCLQLRQIIARFAPPTENDTSAYEADVCTRLNFGLAVEYPMQNPASVRALMQAIVIHENGADPYQPAAYDSAIRDAGHWGDSNALDVV